MMRPDELVWDSMAPLEQQTALSQWVLEELDEIAKIVKCAEERLKNATGDACFDAYCGGPCRVRAQVCALYEELLARKLRYRVEGAGSRIGRQEIRTADVVLDEEHKHGCCIELVLLLASVVYHVQVHPLIVVVGDDTSPTHAVLGYWLIEHTEVTPDGLPVPVLTSDVVAKHRDNLAFVESTDVTEPPIGEPPKGYGDAEADAASHLPPHGKLWYAVDVHACRRLGFNPIQPAARSRPAPYRTRERDPGVALSANEGRPSPPEDASVSPSKGRTGTDRKFVVERLKALCETSFGTLRTLLPDCRRHVNSRCPVSEQVDQLVAWAEGGGPGLDEVVRVAAEEWPQLFQTESAPAQLRAPVRNGKP